MVQEKPWDGFQLELGRAIDRWSGGGQRAFANRLKEHARANEIRIPTSYRTLLNYLGGDTSPPRAWVDAAAVVLRWNPERLWTGEGPERIGGTLDGLTLRYEGYQERSSFLLHYIQRRHHDLPIGAQLMLIRFLDDYFGDDLDGWPRNDGERGGQVAEVLVRFYGPLIDRPKMPYHEEMSLAASLTAAAYLRLTNQGD